MRKIKMLYVFAALSLLLANASPVSARTEPLPACGFDPLVEQMLARTSADGWLGWIKKLSGAEPVWIDGQKTLIQTRYSYAMFAGKENARAFDFILSQVRQWVREDQIELDPYTVENQTWQNLIVTFPGATHPDEVVALTAHMDSKSVRKPFTQAPGADDNATGTAALLEAVRLFRSYRFERTIKVIFFTGEEWGMLGSQAYVKDHDTSRIVGVINLDMLGYDHDQDRCFDLHVGTLPASQPVAACVVNSIHAYGLDLTYDYVTTNATSFSDHSPFWEAGTGAVLIIENIFNQHLPGGCTGKDANPYYHTTVDTVENGVPHSYGFDLARGGIAAAAGLAVPLHGAGKRPVFRAF